MLGGMPRCIFCGEMQQIVKIKYNKYIISCKCKNSSEFKHKKQAIKTLIERQKLYYK